MGMYNFEVACEYVGANGEVLSDMMPRYSSFVPHPRVYSDPYGESRTRQEMADECDINQIMRRYEKSGVISHVNRASPRYLELDGVPDFQASLDLLKNAEEAFMRLPARARATFDNDPRKFVDFASDPANIDDMRAWGLAPPEKPADAPMKVEVVNAPSDLPKPLAEDARAIRERSNQPL